jgi:hypothetical protein
MENIDLPLLPPVEDIIPKKRIAVHAAGLNSLFSKSSKKPMLAPVATAVAGENVEGESQGKLLVTVGSKGILLPPPLKPAPVTQVKKVLSPLVVVKKDPVFEKASLKYASQKKLCLGWAPLPDNVRDFAYFQIQYQFPLDQVVYIGNDLDQSLNGCKHFAFKKLVGGKEEWIFKKLCCVKDCRRVSLTGTKCEAHRRGDTVKKDKVNI